ncbi:MAG: GNAT family N-acetyltransferase [Persicimonas sp.]
MHRLNMQEFRDRLDRYDRAVSRTPHIDRFCSSSCWTLPAFEALSPDHELFVWQGAKNEGFAALCRGSHPRVGRYMQPLEASWGLASPVVGEDVTAVTEEFVAQARRDDDEWDILFLTGVSEDSPQFEALVRGFQPDHFIGIGPSMGRQYAELGGGLEGYLQRRSSKFRANMRRVLRDADEAGIELEYLSDFGDEAACERAFERIVDIERASWKGRKGVGIARGRMRDFYEKMLPCLGRRDALRVVFATLDGVDIAYCFGGLFQETYRGLQMSYHQDYRDHSPGNLVQLEMIERLDEEGLKVYDMGQSMDYKASWTDEEFETIAVIIRA